MFLVGRGDLDEPSLLEVARQELHPDGQARRGEPAGNRDPRDAGQVRRDREDVREYICSGSSVFSPILKAGVGVVGVRMTSHS